MTPTVFGCLHCGIIEREYDEEDELYVWHKCPDCGELSVMSMVLAIDTINGYLREQLEDE
jgi:predicted RNA-binding Zn-ribbon protein involved in translation (DUF1610 family)